MNEVQMINRAFIEKATKIMQEMNKSNDGEYRKIVLEKAIARLQKDNQTLLAEMHMKDIPLVAKFMESAFAAGVAIAATMNNKDIPRNEIGNSNETGNNIIEETEPQYIG
ncbi:MAG: hypothetical protein AABX37_00225 [Nanoarchaeota archaeon]